ncbi:TPA: hypothetical protein ACVU5P_004194 [Vibrio parahaemolyticus]
MPKLNYPVHQKAFLERRRAEPNLTLSDYCRDVGINYNTARRYIKATVSIEEEEPHKLKLSSKEERAKKNQKWAQLFKKYLLVAIEAPTYTAKDFAEDEGLNYNTTRRKFTEMRREGVERDLDARYDNACAKYSAERKRKAKDEQKQRHDEIYAEVKEKSDARTQAVIDLMPAQDNMADRDQRGATFDRRGFIHAFHPQHNHATKHGASSKLFRSCPDRIKKIIKDLQPTDVEFELYSARIQYYSLIEHRETLLAELEEKRESGEPITDSAGEQSTYTREKSKLIVAYAGRLRELEGSITGMVTTISANINAQARLVLAAAKLPSVDQDEEWTIITNTLRQRDEKDWDAMTTLRALEAKGIKKPPTFLLVEAKRELDLIEPEIDDNGISDAEAEARSKEYMKNRKSLAAQIGERRKEAADAFADAEYREATANLPDDEYDDEDDLPDNAPAGGLFDDLNLDDMT